ncbi:transporter [Apilactobacillus apinorum]|uniref:transporter n=1 Tax=Apilactobacillus apinorum TaxID=1218495 RepID=UPI0030E88A56
MKSRMNTWTAIYNIFNAVMLFVSWIFIIGEAIANNGNTEAGVFYIITWIGVVLNVLALYYAKQLSISIVGPVLGIIGSVLSGLALLFAFPSIVLLIISTVFEFLQKPAKKGEPTNEQQ